MSKQIRFLYSKYNKVLDFEQIDAEDARRISVSMGNCVQGTEDFLNKHFEKDFVLTGKEMLEKVYRIQEKYGNVYDLKSNLFFRDKVFYLNENKIKHRNVIFYKGLILYRE